MGDGERGEGGTGKEGKRREARRGRERGQWEWTRPSSCCVHTPIITSNIKTIGLLPAAYNV